jgi:MFS family permease
MSQLPSPAEGAPPRSFAALRHSGYRRYFVTTALAMMGDNIEHVITYWIIFEKFRSPALGGFAVLSHWLPFLLLSVYFGALADRYDCRRLIQFSQVLFMGVSIAWAVLIWTDTLEMWHAAMLLVIHGMAGVLWGPATQMLIHYLVGREEIVSAVRLSATSRQLGILFGPAVGGGLLIVLGPVWGLLVNALFYLPLVWWVTKAPHGGEHRGGEPASTRRGGLADAWTTLKEISGNRTIFAMIFLAGTSSLLVGTAYQPQMPEFAHDFGHDEADSHYTVLLLAGAAGALTAGLLLEARSLLKASPRTAIVLAILWCLSLTGFAVTTNYAVGVTLMFAAGFLNLSFVSMAQALVQLEAPGHMRGRLIGLFYLANNGLRAFSGITVGILGSLIGIHWSLALSAMLLLTVTVVLLAFTVRTG